MLKRCKSPLFASPKSYDISRATRMSETIVVYDREVILAQYTLIGSQGILRSFRKTLECYWSCVHSTVKYNKHEYKGFT